MSYNFSFLPHDVFNRANEVSSTSSILSNILFIIILFIIIYGMINEPGQKHFQVCKNV